MKLGCRGCCIDIPVIAPNMGGALIVLIPVGLCIWGSACGAKGFGLGVWDPAIIIGFCPRVMFDCIRGEGLRPVLKFGLIPVVIGCWKLSPVFRLILLPIPPGEIPVVCVKVEGRAEAGLAERLLYGFVTPSWVADPGIDIGSDVDAVGVLSDVAVNCNGRDALVVGPCNEMRSLNVALLTGICG